MGFVALNRLMFKQKDQRRHRRIHNQKSTKVPKKKDSLCQEDDHSEGGKRSRYPGSNLPEDIWCHIHSLMPLRDAAHSACVSRAFLRSWRCYPNLKFTKETLCLKRNARVGRVARCFTMRVDQILKNHLGIGVKALYLQVPDSWKVDTCRLDRWLQIGITPGIEEVAVFLPRNYRTTKYSFPCSLLFGGCGNSIRHLRLSDCAFRPPVGFDCLRSLTKLQLYTVCTTGDELGNLFSNSFALEQLELIYCGELISLKIPFWLERLSFLRVSECNMLQVIESKAPNLHTLAFHGDPVHLTLGESSQVKTLDFMLSYNWSSVSYAITKLPSTVPTLETLTVLSSSEKVNAPMVADKFLNLKFLEIHFFAKALSPAYDYLSLVSFLDASPALETFILSVNQNEVKHDSVFGNASHMRQILGDKHASIRKVQINGFCSAKSMVELTCHILENATSLESLTVDTICDGFTGADVDRCYVQNISECWPIPRDQILEAHRALRAVDRYILGRVPPAVKLNVLEPCSRCHAIDVELP